MATKTKTAAKLKSVRKVRVTKPKPVETVLVLRTCDKNLQSHGGFQWPESGPVKCDDWSATPACGNGLHGLLWGEGDGSLLNWSDDAKWLVVEIEARLIVDLDRKVKFPHGNVVLRCAAGRRSRWIRRERSALRGRRKAMKTEDAPTAPVDAVVLRVADRITRAIFKTGNEPGSPCRRIAYIGGTYPDNERQQGGSCEESLRSIIFAAIREQSEPVVPRRVWNWRRAKNPHEIVEILQFITKIF